MKEYLFSYGTLQKEKVQIELFGRILHGSTDTLGGYRAATIEIKDELFLSKGEEKYQQIWGVKVKINILKEYINCANLHWWRV